MNEDHADAVLSYVHRFGAVAAADAARLVSINPTHMLISAIVGSTTQTAFDHSLKDAKDARDTLISMARPGKS